MDEAVAESLKTGELVIDDVRREFDVLHQMSSSLLLFDMKRKRLESHFDSLVDLIQRKQTEALETIRVKEEETKARDERLEEQENRLKSIMKVKMEELEEERKRVESKAAEMERELNEANMDTERLAVELCKKEREMRQLKIDAERMATELCEKKKEVNEMKNVVGDLTARIREDARLGVTCKRLTGENFTLREEVKSLSKELENREKGLNDILKVKMKKVAEGIERAERRAVEKEKEMRIVKMDKERMVVQLCGKEKEVSEMKKTLNDLTSRIQEDAKFSLTCKRLSGENFAFREEVKSLTKELEKREKRFNDILKVKMKEVAEDRERKERRAAEKEKEMRVVKLDNERMIAQLCDKEKEANEMKKTVDDLTARIHEDARLSVNLKRLSGENFALREEVNSLRKELEKQEKRLNDAIKVKIREVRDERERVEKQAAEKEKEIRDVKMDKERLVLELCDKEKKLNEMKKTMDDLTARSNEDAMLDATNQVLSDEKSALREEVKSLTQQLELKSHPLRREEHLSAIQSFLQILTSAGIISSELVQIFYEKVF